MVHHPGPAREIGASHAARIALPASDPVIFRSLQRRAAASEPRCLAVRCPVGQLRVIAIWQILGHYASRVLRTHVINDSKHACEELSLTLVDISDDALSDMVVRLSDLPWVLDAWFYP